MSVSLLLVLQAFEGGFVAECPEGALKAEDVVIAVDGRPAATLADLRRRVGEAIGRPLRLRVKRGAQELDLDWTPPPGRYRLTEWPPVAELFRREHLAQAEDPGVKAGVKAIQAAVSGAARTAERQFAAAEDVSDPALAWAEAWLQLRSKNAPAAAGPLLAKAQKAADAGTRPLDRRLAGLCRVSAAWKHLQEGFPDRAPRELRAARDLGADISEAARAAAKALGPDAPDGRRIRAEAFEDDPLDPEEAELLARAAGNEAERRRYADAAARLRGTSKRDPALDLRDLADRVEAGTSTPFDLAGFLQKHAEQLAPADKASGLDAIARAHESERDWEAALRARIEGLGVFPTLARARALDRLARMSNRHAEALRTLRGFWKAEGNDAAAKEYTAVYLALEQHAYLQEGAKAVAEAARRASQGRAEEAAAFLRARAEQTGLAELAVAAGLLLGDAGLLDDGERAEAFGAELKFRERTSWEQDGHFRYYLLVARGAADKDDEPWGTRRFLEEGTLPGASEALNQALRAGLHRTFDRKEKALEHLRMAAKALARPDADRGWLPVYAEGRWCPRVYDYVQALDARLEAKLKLPDR